MKILSEHLIGQLREIAKNNDLWWDEPVPRRDYAYPALEWVNDDRKLTIFFKEKETIFVKKCGINSVEGKLRNNKDFCPLWRWVAGVDSLFEKIND